MELQHVRTADLKIYARNPRTHSPAQVRQIAASIEQFGFTNPLLIDDSQQLIAGHGRLAAAQLLRLETVPCIVLDGLDETQRQALVIADNKIAENAGWDLSLLKLELGDLAGMGFDLGLTGFSVDELLGIMSPAQPTGPGPSLADRFLVPPFSVLNAREGWWQDRKRAWIGIGIQSELGRGDTGANNPHDGRNMADGLVSLRNRQKANRGPVPGGAEPNSAMRGGRNGQPNAWREFRDASPGGRPAAYTTQEWVNDKQLQGLSGEQSGTSIFDPVLTELVYRWFSPPGGLILDPLAGGSVRGIVAARLGRSYVGVELREEQVAANQAQAEAICPEAALDWIIGDARDITELCAGREADLLFSCPPYADLEQYSDDPRDLSTLEYGAFRDAYRDIVAKSCALLKPDRFACFVVGEVRDKRGHYYDFVGDTVQAFRDAGLEFYNEAILVTAVGSLPIRVAKQFTSGRKLGKTHQNVLVFCKGDARRATDACGPVEIADIEEQLESVTQSTNRPEADTRQPGPATATAG